MPDHDGTFREPDPSLYMTRGTLYDNIANLSPVFVELVTGQYGGTLMGAQEFHGDLLTAVEGALWQPESIGPYRVDSAPDLRRVVVAVDPPGSTTGAEAGIVVCGLGRASMPVDAGVLAEARRAGMAAELIASTRHAYVLADVSLRERTDAWAAAAVAAYRGYGAEGIVGEVNFGGDMVRAAIHAIEPDDPIHRGAGQPREGHQGRARRAALRPWTGAPRRPVRSARIVFFQFFSGHNFKYFGF